jgi:branched-chain amino acid transport system substrate-binding protein
MAGGWPRLRSGRRADPGGRGGVEMRIMNFFRGDALPQWNTWALGAVSAVSIVALAGCGPSGVRPTAAVSPTLPIESTPLTAPGVTGDNFGGGGKRIALIVPLTQQDGPSAVGQSMRNAAELAVAEAGGGAVTVIVKDDQSSPEGARAAAQAAIAEGADVIIGPLYAGGVREAGRVARAAGKPMIAFSTDASTAGPGVYLLSFLVEGYVDRVLEFAASRGKRSVAALAPETDYGNIAIAQFQQSAAARGMRVQAIERYGRGNVTAAAQKIGAVAGQIDALFIPEQADQTVSVAQALTAAGVDPTRVQILGTGLWNDTRVLRVPMLQGAWFAAPDNSGFNAYAAKYRSKFNSDPTRISTLAYDAMSLAAALTNLQGGVTEQALTNASGFNGADGLFRFRGDGQNERGLSVLQIRSGTTTIVSPAPRSFGSGA